MSQELTLQKWLPKTKKKRAVIYDFDNTLFKSPTREEGEPLYLKAKGEAWPHRGWWGRVETLMPPVVPAEITEELFIRATLDAYRADRTCENTNVYLMTGRPWKMEKRVREILDAVNCTFDGYFYRGMKDAPNFGDTFDIKVALIRDRIIHPGLEVLELWEDRPEHTAKFREEARRWRRNFDRHLEKVLIHDVYLGQTHTI